MTHYTHIQIGGARVLAFDPMQGMLVASKPSNNQIMPGYGLMKVHIQSYITS